MGLTTDRLVRGILDLTDLLGVGDRLFDPLLRWRDKRERERPRRPPKWDYGVVILMDALGYKGIWRRSHNADIVLRKLTSIQRSLMSLADQWMGYGLWGRFMFAGVPNAVDPIVRGVSDSTLILVRLPREDKRMHDFFLYFSLALAQHAYVEGAKLEPGWATRGAFAVGEFVAEPAGPFIIGPAVDEAAEAMESSAGAFVYAAPSALEALEGLRRREEFFDEGGLGWLASLQTVPWRVPLRRDHGHIETLVLNPIGMDEAFRRRETIDRILGCFSDEPKVAKYRDATDEFLRHVDGITAAEIAKRSR